MDETPSRKRFIIPALLLSLYVAQCLWFVGTQSLCCDEDAHLSSGLTIWRHRDFNHINDHPPLERMLSTIVLAATHTLVPGESAPTAPGAARVDLQPERSTRLSRPLIIPLGIVLACLVWSSCRLWFSEAAANFALALFALSPELIGNYSVASTDGAGALSIFAMALWLVQWWSAPTLRNTVVLGLVTGVALVSKFYTLPLVLLVLAVVLLHPLSSSSLRFWKWDWRALFVTAATAVLVVWTVYFFHVGVLSISDQNVYVSGMESASLWHFPFPGHISFPIPAPEFVTGVAHVSWHNRIGHPSFLLGRVAWHGFLFYYPLAMVLKWPIIILALAFAGAFLILKKRTGPPRIFFLPPLAFLAMALLIGHIQIGIRHLLPVYPFLLVAAAAVWQGAVTRRQKFFLIFLLAVQSIDIARYAPNQLSYFNFFVPEPSVYKIVTDSNVNWGQGMLAVRKYQAQHPEETLYISQPDFELYGVRGFPLRPGERVTGTVIVSPTELSGQLQSDRNAYRWLLRYPIKTVLDHALYVFDVPKEAARR